MTKRIISKEGDLLRWGKKGTGASEKKFPSA